MKMHCFIAALATVMLAGCGMAETTAVTAAQAEAAVEQAKEGEKLKAKIQEDLAAAQATSKQRLEDAE